MTTGCMSLLNCEIYQCGRVSKVASTVPILIIAPLLVQFLVWEDLGANKQAGEQLLKIFRNIECRLLMQTKCCKYVYYHSGELTFFFIKSENKKITS